MAVQKHFWYFHITTHHQFSVLPVLEKTYSGHYKSERRSSLQLIYTVGILGERFWSAVVWTEEIMNQTCRQRIRTCQMFRFFRVIRVFSPRKLEACYHKNTKIMVILQVWCPVLDEYTYTHKLTVKITEKFDSDYWK